MNLSPILQQIDALKKEADALQPVKQEYEQKFWTKYRLEFNYNSNHIEGNTLTYGHTQLLLIFDKVGGDYTLRELEEMKAHDVALRLVKEAALDPEHLLTEKFIKEINQTILVRPYYKEAITEDGQPTRRLIEPGQYKKFPNSVRLENGEIFHYASPEETASKMGDLIQWIRAEEEKKKLHPVQLAALVHYYFVRIHPFDDSNGRTSRLLMNYFLMRYGYAPLVIESADKKNYLNTLNRADTGDVNAFVEYISRLALKWQEIFTSAAKGEEIEDDDDYKKEIALLKRNLKTNNERIEQTLTNTVFKNIIHNSISPLLCAITKELNSFDDFFLESTMVIIFQSEKHWKDTPTTNNIEIILGALQNLPIKNIPVIIDFIYTHTNLRKVSNLNSNFQTHFKFEFDKFKYSVKTYPNEKLSEISVLYHEILSDDIINKISTECAKNELNFIKNILI